MDWTNWQTYAAPTIVLVVIILFVRKWLKKSDANCSGGCSGCGAPKGKKKQRVKNTSP